MMPVNRYMDYPQSCHGTHFSYPYNCYPSWIPPQTEAETVQSAVTHEPWFHGWSGYGYPNPPECHSCCNHGYPPRYYNWKHPHSFPLQPMLYHHGPCYPEIDPRLAIHHCPPHFSREKPGYETDKIMHRHHCCVCPSHTCNGKGENALKIEEQEPEMEKKESEPYGLAQFKNYPYSMLCTPPEYMRNREASKSSESDPKLLNGWFPLDIINNKRVSDLGSSVWNGWSPFDVNGIRKVELDEHKNKRKDEQNEESEGKIPDSVFRMPVYGKPNEVVKESDASSKDLEEPKKKCMIIPVNFPSILNRREEVAKDYSGTNLQSNVKENEVEKNRVSAIKMEGSENNNSDDSKNPNRISVKQLEERGDRNCSNENAKQRSLRPPKAGKLPPVCLRVDPLPRRKSRSPSPPLGEKLLKETNGTSKSSSSLATDKQQDLIAKEPAFVHNLEKKVKPPIEVEDKMLDQDKEQDSTNLSRSYVPNNKEVLPELKTEEKEMRGERTEVEQGEKEAREKSEVKNGKDFSPVEAAVKIQSHYRGYEVRKWEPLKKLRQIARVREQMNEIRNQVIALESSNLKKDEKQAVLIGEAIMSLLLQLDTVQGLQPSVREIRKSVARELACLQERLDLSLANEKAEIPTSTEASEEPSVKPIMESTECVQASIAQSKDSEQDKNLCIVGNNSNFQLAENTGNREETEQDLLDVPSSRAEESVPSLVSNQYADSVKQSVTTSEKELMPLQDDCAATETCVAMDYDVKNDLYSHGEPEVIGDNLRDNEILEPTKDGDVGNIFVAEHKSDLVFDEVSASLVEEEGFDSKVRAESVVAEAGSSLVGKASDQALADYDAEVLDKESSISTVGDYEHECTPDAAEVLLGEPKPPLVNEEEKGGELLKVLEQQGHVASHVEESIKVPNACDLDALKDLNTASSRSVNSGAISMKGMEIPSSPKENQIDESAKDSEVPKEQEVMDNLSKGMAEELANKKVMAEVTDAENLEAKVIDIAPESAVVVKEEKDDPYLCVLSVDQQEKKDVLVKENEKLRDMIEKLIKAGNDQLTVISNLNSRVKDLEKKVIRKRKQGIRTQRKAAKLQNVRQGKVCPEKTL